MNNIKIVNDELRKRTDKNIVFDYNGKTFFYFKENLGDNKNIYCETEIHYNNELVYSDKLL